MKRSLVLVHAAPLTRLGVWWRLRALFGLSSTFAVFGPPSAFAVLGPSSAFAVLGPSPASMP
ncbi:hypothetical protein BJY16_005949 [Actinoplanes octamycinicus]|uniref:Uncharacterized protein n=1 Tax=Actinoplanes octamycinicus TaxID=135948 RepID=A0A7W7H1X0_9ACTN|nr:hypothetical protein [Actinoplanes octamycinicus]MBB4742490.1 hypothetical protein [Actinoplanes octamycinicus]